jgi:hypothetical protein
MKELRRCLWLAATLMAAVGPAMADLDVAMQLDCPAEATAGSTITTNLHLENRECSVSSVRVISSIAGSADQSLGGFGIFGPVVADPMISVPAATEIIPGNGCWPLNITPGVNDVAVLTPPAIPGSLVGTVATFVLIAEWDDGVSEETEVAQCLVNILPAP